MFRKTNTQSAQYNIFSCAFCGSQAVQGCTFRFGELEGCRRAFCAQHRGQVVIDVIPLQTGP